MKRQALLIKLYRNQVDEKRRILADLERLHESMLAQRAALEAEVHAEQGAALASTELGMAYGAYAAQVVTRRSNLERSIAAIEDQIEAAKDDVLEAFRTLKKHEVARDLRQRREQAAADKQEQARLDEIALAAFRRKLAS